MNYPSEDEQKYGKYADLEDLDKGSDGRMRRTFMQFVDVNERIAFIHRSNFTADQWLFENDNSTDQANPKQNVVYLELDTMADIGFWDLRRVLISGLYKQSDPLPEAFYVALRQKAFRNIDAEYKDLGSYAGLEDLTLKTFADLPQDFLNGLRNYEIIIRSCQEKRFQKQLFTDAIAKICRDHTKRPLTILLYASRLGHATPYVVRITENDTCEILFLSSLKRFSDEYFVKILKAGVKLGTGIHDYYIKVWASDMLSIESSTFSSFIAAIFLFDVIPNQTLSKQFRELSEVVQAAVNNEKMVRRLFARINWWSEHVQDEHINEHQLCAMKIVFRQLLYYVCKSEPKKTVDLPDDPESVAMYGKFLNVFKININDEQFLRLFNRVEYNNAFDSPLPSRERSVSDHVRDRVRGDINIFSRENWATHKEEILETLGRDGNAEVAKSLNKIARHARYHLSSKLNTERAKAGREKYKKLTKLFQDPENLQENLEKCLNKTPKDSALLKNRRGFFGAYQNFSRLADKIGIDHYRFKNRAAISTTEHNLIRLHTLLEQQDEDNSSLESLSSS